MQGAELLTLLVLAGNAAPSFASSSARPLICCQQLLQLAGPWHLPFGTSCRLVLLVSSVADPVQPMTLCAADPEMIRQVSVAKFRAFHDRPGLVNVPRASMRSKRIRMLQSGLLVAK